MLLTFHGSDLRRIKKIKIYHFLFKWVDAVLFVNEAMRSDLEPIFKNKLLIHSPSGVDLNFYENLNIARKKQIVTVGNLRWQKGYDDLLRSFQLFVKTKPDYVLVFLGDGILRLDLEQQARDLGIDKCVAFKGRVTSDEVRANFM